MFQHWPVDFVEELLVQVHLVARVNAEKIPVIGRVVNLAQRETVRYFCGTVRFGVRNDVGGVE